MLTQEQINNLKTGDELVHTVYYNGKDDKGYIRCDFSPRYSFFVNTFAVDPGVLSLPAENHPKHDPCRLFKKGDKVRVVEWNGRNPCPLNDINDVDFPADWQTEFYTVIEGESNEDCNCVLKHDNPQFSIIVIHPAHLELVTPVEELEPYGVTDNLYGCIVFKDNPGNVVANFNNTHPHAKEAAEAERDRLNAEYRKEQNND